LDVNEASAQGLRNAIQNECHTKFLKKLWAFENCKFYGAMLHGKSKGEVQIKRKELDMKRGMLETSLKVDMWDYAWQHGIRTRNLIVRKKDAAPDGTGNPHGNPPLNQFSRNHVSVEECKRILHYSLIPGTAALVQIP
jgi:hypothetical protein